MPFLVTDLQTAELVKVSANAFLATKISFINAISEVCEAVDADVTLLADALGYDPRIGRRFLNAGLGFGGGCLPKDIRAFMARAGELGANHALTFLREVDSINMRRRTRMVDLATKACGGSLLGANVAVLGAAFKPESDDVRDSPALNVAGMLQLNGATVNVYDPKAMENSQRLFPTLNYSTSVVEACERADAVLVLTEWREFVELDPARPCRHGARQSRCRRPQLPRHRPVDQRRLAGVLPGQERGQGQPADACLSIPSKPCHNSMKTSSTTRSRGTSRFSYHQVATPPHADCVARARIQAASSTVMPFTDLASAAPNRMRSAMACGAAVGDLLTDRGDLRVGRGISVQEAPHERVLLDELEVVRDARADAAPRPTRPRGAAASVPSTARRVVRGP